MIEGEEEEVVSSLEGEEEERTCTYEWECSDVSCVKDQDNHLVFCTQECQLKYHKHKLMEQMNPFKVEEDNFKHLWILHVSLTRQFLLEVVNDGISSENLPSIQSELVQNQFHIGNKFKIPYDNDFGEAVTRLLTEHILLAKKVIEQLLKRVDLTEANETVDIDKYREDGDESNNIYQQWLKQSIIIAKALYHRMAPGNKDIKKKFIQFMTEHIEMTLEEFVSEVNGDTDKSLKFYHHAVKDIIQFAEFMVSLLLEQIQMKKKDKEEEEQTAIVSVKTKI